MTPQEVSRAYDDVVYLSHNNRPDSKYLLIYKCKVKVGGEWKSGYAYKDCSEGYTTEVYVREEDNFSNFVLWEQK